MSAPQQVRDDGFGLLSIFDSLFFWSWCRLSVPSQRNRNGTASASNMGRIVAHTFRKSQQVAAQAAQAVAAQSLVHSAGISPTNNNFGGYGAGNGAIPFSPMDGMTGGLGGMAGMKPNSLSREHPPRNDDRRLMQCCSRWRPAEYSVHAG